MRGFTSVARKLPTVKHIGYFPAAGRDNHRETPFKNIQLVICIFPICSGKIGKLFTLTLVLMLIVNLKTFRTSIYGMLNVISINSLSKWRGAANPMQKRNFQNTTR